MSIPLGHEALGLWLPDARDMSLVFYKQCRPGPFALYSLPTALRLSHSLPFSDLSLLSFACLKRGQRRFFLKLPPRPVLAQEYFFVQENPLHHHGPQSSPTVCCLTEQSDGTLKACWLKLGISFQISGQGASLTGVPTSESCTQTNDYTSEPASPEGS